MLSSPSSNDTELVVQRREQRQREEAVRDGRAEGAGGGADGIDVDPLRVARRAREGVDPVLVDRQPCARAEAHACREIDRQHRTLG